MPVHKKTTDFDKLRREFPMLSGRTGRGLTYLDSAASSQTPLAVLAAMDDYYRRYRANIHRGMYPASLEATERYETSRAKMADFLNAAPDEIVFTRGATESLNLLAQTLSQRLGPGDEVAISIMEHHSNLVPWQQLAKSRGFKLVFIGLTPDFSLDIESAKRLITRRTKIVSIMHVSNALGTVNPVAELAKMAHAVGALMIVDAAQSAGHRPLDVRALDCDFLALSGHKMFGPTGTGVLYGRRERLAELPPFLYGGDMIVRVTKEDAEWNDPPWKFEAGTPNIAGVIGLGAAVDFIRRVGLKEIAAHERHLVNYAIKRLAKIKGLKVIGPAAGVDRGAVVSFVVGNIHPHDMTNVLATRGVCVRAGHHCAMPLMLELGLVGTTRASFSIYNDERDVDTLAEAIGKAQEIFKL